MSPRIPRLSPNVRLSGDCPDIRAALAGYLGLATMYAGRGFQHVAQQGALALEQGLQVGAQVGFQCVQASLVAAVSTTSRPRMSAGTSLVLSTSSSGRSRLATV